MFFINILTFYKSDVCAHLNVPIKRKICDILCNEKIHVDIFTLRMPYINHHSIRLGHSWDRNIKLNKMKCIFQFCLVDFRIYGMETLYTHTQLKFVVTEKNNWAWNSRQMLCWPKMSRSSCRKVVRIRVGIMFKEQACYHNTML